MQIIKSIVVLLVVVILQSCYTMLYPPQTLPQTVTTIVSEPAMASTIGGSGMYGWDPYWEPALPFTSYHQGYGASYYSPYNYYDYQHPYYAPVYVVSETSDPIPARDFNRDEKQGGSRARDLNNSSVSASSGSKAGSLGQGSGMSSAVSEIIAPVKNPVVTPPQRNKAKVSQNMLADPPRKNIKIGRINRPVPVKKQKKVEKSDSPPPQKRTRTRK